MYRRGRYNYRRTWGWARQDFVHGDDFLSRLARRDVHAPRGLRSGAPIESGQSRPCPLLPRVAHVAGGSSVLVPRMTTLSVASAADLRDRIQKAVARGTPLRIVGGGTWLDAGRPVRSVESVSTSGLSGIVDYVPGDLTLTARAGTSLAEIRREAGKNNQWMALDPHGADDATLGATIATASAGPLATAFGTPRDLVLGIEFVTGTGTIARGGGRVVKNVAGFDITRLMTGAWGTLGVITEATVRLHARPQADETIVVSMARDGSVDRTRQLLRRLAFTAYACEVL